METKYFLYFAILPDGQSSWSLQFAAVAVNDREESSVRDVENLQLERFEITRIYWVSGALRLVYLPSFYTTQQWSVTVSVFI